MTHYTIGDRFNSATATVTVTGEHTEANGDRILEVTIDAYGETFEVIDWMLDGIDFEYVGRE